MQPLEVLEIIDAVEAVFKAKQRIPEELYGTRFFGLMDIWEYFAVWDERLCDACSAEEAIKYYQGSSIRSAFPYMEIIDENMIEVKVHPNCRCVLIRVQPESEHYTEALTKLTD